MRMRRHRMNRHRDSIFDPEAADKAVKRIKFRYYRIGFLMIAFPILNLLINLLYIFEYTLPFELPIPDSRLRKDVLKCFPPYIVSAKNPLPEWKKRFISNNRIFWENNAQLLDNDWLSTVRGFEQTYQKFEWQVGDEERDIWKHMIQFRPSGIRVKRTNYIPALVAIAQIPIIGWQKRRMTPKECARAQDFDVDGVISQSYVLSKVDSVAYKQLGNAVNVKLTKVIMQEIENYMM